jgi:2-polyprenyl-3-methyl-5-hydroxy-6-metoxy-1,4-benzoquinol methylase
MAVTNWSSFWQSDHGNFDAIMAINTGYFADKFIEQFDLSNRSRILDFGCGPGLLLQRLSLRTQLISGVDINPYYIEICRKNFPKLSVHPLSEDKPLSTVLGTSEFDFILLVSVSQYFEDEKHLKNIVQQLATHLAKDGKLIIADVIDPATSGTRDLVALVHQASKVGKLFSLIRFLMFLTFSSYRKVLVKKKLLKIDRGLAATLGIENSLHMSELPGLTIHPTRRNYLFSKIIT